MRVAAEPVEPVVHQPVGPAIGIAEAEIEIAAYGDAETDEEQRQANDITLPSSRPALFQSIEATTKVATMPPRNNPQKARLCQLPGSGVGQMRKGGAKRVRQQEKVEDERRRQAPQAKIKSWFRTNRFLRRNAKRITLLLDSACTYKQADSSVAFAGERPRSSGCRRRLRAAWRARRRSRRRSRAYWPLMSGFPPPLQARACWRRRAPAPRFRHRARS